MEGTGASATLRFVPDQRRISILSGWRTIGFKTKPEIALEQIQWACAVWHSVFTQCELAFDPRLRGTSTPWNDHALTFRPYDEAQRLPRLSGF